jgi:K+-sensing histidine kinase KdpD
LNNGTEDDDRLFYFAAGPIAAILLGMALVPVRELTSVSNWAFLFVAALTITVAGLGGRTPAVATALASALSLDFFLTVPYLQLRIDDKHDVIAFAGLASCGLIAAALGTGRRQSTAARTSRKQVELLELAISEAESGGPVEDALARVLRACPAVLPLAGAVVRDAHNVVVAAPARADVMRAIPTEVQELAAILSARSRPLSSEGCRIALTAGGAPVGWLDVWGNGYPANEESRRVLAAIARIVAALLGRMRARAAPPDPQV